MRFTAIVVGLVFSVATAHGDEGRPVTVTPPETDAILANPGMGWETFHHPGRQDKSLPSWIPSTVQYARWGWGELEPKPGQLNTAFLDKELKDSHDSGQTLAFRVMCCSTSVGHPYHPSWLKELGAKDLLAKYDAFTFPIPDLDDPIVLQRHLDFIHRLGARYDGHPDLDHIDLGTVGWWGEWHLSGGAPPNKMPTIQTQLKIVDAYLAAFKKTPVLMLIGGKESLKRATDGGAGWRADCLGDMGGFGKNWCHMRNGYPLYIREAGIQDVWKTAPVAWETCWDMRKWVSEGWPLRYIFNYALACHASYINNKSAPLPQAENVRPEVERFLRRLGYRLVLKELTHPSQVAPGAKLKLVMKWQNTGSAPCYKPYRLAYRLAGANGPAFHVIGETPVNRWLPGSVPLFTESFMKEPPDLPPGDVHSVEHVLTLPETLSDGDYNLSIAVVDATTGQPAVRLGIQGRADDGWYPVSKVRVGR